VSTGSIEIRSVESAAQIKKSRQFRAGSLVVPRASVQPKRADDMKRLIPPESNQGLGLFQLLCLFQGFLCHVSCSGFIRRLSGHSL
jgi:hypothetical protein